MGTPRPHQPACSSPISVAAHLPAVPDFLSLTRSREGQVLTLEQGVAAGDARGPQAIAPQLCSLNAARMQGASAPASASCSAAAAAAHADSPPPGLRQQLSAGIHPRWAAHPPNLPLLAPWTPSTHLLRTATPTAGEAGWDGVSLPLGAGTSRDTKPH